MSESVKMRQHVERQIARRFLLDALAAGYRVNIDNGGDTYELPEPSDTLKIILDAMFAADDDRLYLFKPGADKPFAWIWFVYGNSGWDVISDHTTNIRALVERASKLADKYA